MRTAPTSSRCSPTTACAAISRIRSPTASPRPKNSAPACRFTTSRNRARCARSRSSKCRASASTGCGGPAAAMPMCRRISTASPTTSFAWSISRPSPSRRSSRNGGCRA
ncbi:hypothetical protein BKD09_21165 [Bradyrhizobium japonicum]|uniref:Uncharacterized protein n=1 Tax=Bradyrhizobium japonicum TaxID=375 RepID=A0A1L3FC13_BRAJP|nr:hypothetical protein BKD09_21165 [Bradyrhizobium japonicum]